MSCHGNINSIAIGVSCGTISLPSFNGLRCKLAKIALFIAFVKERFHNAVEIDILGIFEEYSSLQIWPPPKKIFQGE